MVFEKRVLRRISGRKREEDFRWSVVTTSWRVFKLRMERSPVVESSCEYIE
jgi:hypothetical protein